LKVNLRLYVLPLFLLTGIIAFPQAKYTLSGYVKDAKTGEVLIGASVLVRELTSTGTYSNQYGFYSLTIPAGNYTITYQFIGYNPKTFSISLNKNMKQEVSLEEKLSELKEVIITGEKKNENVVKNEMGVEKLALREIKNIPVLMGERDVLKTLQLTPGVKSAGEGNSGFYVRGGAADQNLILLDEATVYNASHLLGFFSIFNSDAIKDVTLYKGSQPAEYGGRLSSVLDIRMKEGNDKDFGVEGGIGIISSRLKLEGPIVKNKGSFTISGRRTYADLFLLLSNDTTLRKSRLYFYDLNAKGNYEINKNNRVFVSGYFGKDVAGFASRFGIDWGNGTGTLRWNHLYSDRLFSNTSLIFSNYDYKIHVNFGSTKGLIISRIRNWNLKEDYEYFINSKSKLKFGFNSIYHTIIPGVVTLETNSRINELHLTNKHAWENAVYISDEYRPFNSLSLEFGLRLSSFSVVGPGSFYNYDASGNTVDTLNYSQGRFIKTYFNPQPRVSINYVISDKSSIKASYSRNAQDLHLLSNSTSGDPTDSWISSSNNVKSELTDQIALGYFRNFKENIFEFSAEIYYKYLQNQIDYKDGAQVTLNENAESQLLFGTGRAYGIELFLKKKYGKLNGWIGYTLAKSEKRIDGINNNKYYPARQDRTHDISIVGIYELSKKWTISATWVYYTGNAVTFPSGKYMVNGLVTNYYTERNGYRMPAYHRLDAGVTWLNVKTSKFESSFNFSCYNVYGRENAYSIDFQQDPNDATKTQAVQTTLFRWVPSISYNIKF
jgi:hypothetical protein